MDCNTGCILSKELRRKQKIETNIEQILEFEDESDRESFFEDYIAGQTNINYLIGFAKGMKSRKDIRRSQKNYYVGLINDRILELDKK